MNEYFMNHRLKTIPNRILISSYLYNHYPYGNNILLPPLVNIFDEKWKSVIQDYPEMVLKYQGFKILYSGTPDNKDSLMELINATLSILDESKNVQIIVAGVSEDRALDFFLKKEDYYNNRQHFVFLGRIPQNSVPAYYQIADFSAIIRRPTRKNMAGFPTKMAESMAAGCPVIASDFSDITKYVCDGRNGIVLHDSSVYSIIDGLRRILAFSSQDIAEMKQNARLCGERYFDYRNYKTVFQEFINNLK